MATFTANNSNDIFQKTEICEVREISAYAGPLVAGRPFGAKLDIEGTELSIMPWLLAQPNLRFLIFESAHNQDKLYNAVMESGLTLYGLRRHPFMLRVTRIDSFAEVMDFHDLVVIKLSTTKGTAKELHPKCIAKLMK
jgi:hypothetical protein